MRFQELLENSLTKNPEEQQSSARQRFAAEVRGHGMKLWQPGDPWTAVGERFLVGVAAAYSVHDLKLMDDIDAGVRSGHIVSSAVDIFDISNIGNMSEFEEYIPGMTPVTQSPVLGIWVDGQLTERLQGFKAKQRLLLALRQADSTT